MSISLRFLGAARNVTGSRYLLEANGTRLLIDCGLYQERDFTVRNWEPFVSDPPNLDGVLLTHAHLDHCGLLPRLVKAGFTGRIYTTAASADIVRIMLLDAGKLQEEDAFFKKRRHQREGRSGPHPEVPLYTVEDAEATLPQLEPVGYDEEVALGDGVSAVFRDAGHVLGSAMIMVTVTDGAEKRQILFSGDVGRKKKPILRDPTVFREADYVVIESTYGDRVHEDVAEIPDRLAEVINETHRAGGNIIIPTFALERAQEILYHLNELLIAERIPQLKVYLDSPMANKITEVFKTHPELYDKEMMALVKEHNSPLRFPGLTPTPSVEDSKAISEAKGTSIILAGSGMCTGGRVKHHLVTNIGRPESTILFVGYQAVGTPGRSIVDGIKNIRILGQQYPVNAKVVQIHGFSAHADRNELYEWISGLERAPRKVFVTHGEENAALAFSSFLQEKTGWPVTVPSYGDEVTLA